MSGRGMEIVSPATYIHNSNWVFQESKGTTRWTHQENKQFEKALAYFDTDTPDKWFKLAALIPGKTVADVINHYRELEEDVSDIEAGFIPVLPAYATSRPNHDHSFTLDWIGDNPHAFIDEVNQLYGKQTASGRSSDHDRKKGVPWTEDEHRQFLMGLKKYGKGDWRNISRYFVTTRTPTQVASHAQKYFIRQLNGDKDKRRSSIHDITTVHLPNDDPVPSSPENNKQQSPPEDKQQHQEMLGWSHTNTNPDSFLRISPLGIKFEEQAFLEGSRISEYGVCNLMQHHN